MISKLSLSSNILLFFLYLMLHIKISDLALIEFYFKMNTYKHIEFSIRERKGSLKGLRGKKRGLVFSNILTRRF